MKKIPLLLSLISVFVISSFSFSSVLGNDATAPNAVTVTHYGSENWSPIGSAEDPVYVYEYVAFLNQSAEACHANEWFYSDYYDYSFMTCSTATTANVCILRQGNSWHGGEYHYVALTGRENEIIDALSLAKLQKEFTAWRQEERIERVKEEPKRDPEEVTTNPREEEFTSNPTEDELADYINCKIEQTSSSLERAAEIERRYPEATPLVSSSGIQTLWQQVDSLVTHLTPYDETDSIVHMDDDGRFYRVKTHYEISNAACNEMLQHWGLTLVEGNTPSVMASKRALSVIELDSSKGDIRQPWATLFQQSNANGTESPMEFVFDVVTTEKMPIAFPLVPEPSKSAPDTGKNEFKDPRKTPKKTKSEPHGSRHTTKDSPQHKPSTPKHKPEAPKKTRKGR